MTEELNQLKFNILEEQEENLSPEKNPAAFLQLAREYLATGHTFRFIMTIEDYTYYNISKRDNITPKEIARGLQEVNEYLDKDAKNSRGHYFKGFLLFLRQDWAAAMSEFYIAEGFKLDVKYLTRMVKYLDICRNKAREREEFISQSRAHTFVKKTAKVKQITTRIDEIAGSKSNLSQEEKIYLCTYNRSMIGKAVDFYNQDHLEEMDEMNFNLRLLVFGEYIKKPPVCPDGGVYTLLQGPVPTCSVHGR
jgi:hypothetical protein